MIDEALAKLDVKPNRFYTLSKLYDVLSEIGLTNMKRSSFTTDWVKRRVDKGVLTLPPKHGFERWKITGKQLEAIVRAFVPGGVGYYHYNNEPIFTENEGQEAGAS